MSTLIHGPQRHVFLVLDVDSVSSGNWIGIRAALGDFVAGQFFERVALWFEGNKFASWCETEEGGADVDDRAVAASTHAAAHSTAASAGTESAGAVATAAPAFFRLITLFFVRLFRLILLHELDELSLDRTKI